MTTKTYATYEQAAADYMAAFGALLQAPQEEKTARRRAAALVPPQALVERADAIAEVSSGMASLALQELEGAPPGLSEGLSGQLAAQAAAELQLAVELLQIAEQPPAGPPRGGEDLREVPKAAPRRAAQASALPGAIASLQRAMAAPASQGLPAGRPRRGVAPADLGEAKKALRQAALTAVKAISEQAGELGQSIALDLITQTEWRAVVDGAAMINKEIAAKLEALKEGVGALVKRAVSVAAKTLLNVFDKIMALLGKDAEDAARKKVKEWLDQIKEEQKVDLLGKLVAKLYRLDDFETALDGWLDKAPADLDKVNGAAGAVREVAPKFAALAGHLATVENAAVLAKRFIKLPQVLAAVAGIQVLLLAVVVYTGYDYIGFREFKFPNLARGVAQAVQEGLA